MTFSVLPCNTECLPNLSIKINCKCCLIEISNQYICIYIYIYIYAVCILIDSSEHRCSIIYLPFTLNKHHFSLGNTLHNYRQTMVFSLTDLPHFMKLIKKVILATARLS
jgi:hypothetical protein